MDGKQIVALIDAADPNDNATFGIIIRGVISAGLVDVPWFVGMFGVSQPTVERWISGKSFPHYLMREGVYKALKEKLQKDA